MVDDELEVEVGDPGARVALAGRGLADVAPAAAEAEVAALDRVEEHRAVDGLGGHANMKAASPSSLASRKSGPEGRDHGADEVREDVLSVVQLDVGQVARCSRRCRR